MAKLARQSAIDPRYRNAKNELRALLLRNTRTADHPNNSLLTSTRAIALANDYGGRLKRHLNITTHPTWTVWRSHTIRSFLVAENIPWRGKGNAGGH